MVDAAFGSHVVIFYLTVVLHSLNFGEEQNVNFIKHLHVIVVTCTIRSPIFEEH